VPAEQSFATQVQTPRRLDGGLRCDLHSTYFFTDKINLGSHGEGSLREVQLSGDLSLGSEVLLVGGKGVSQSFGLSWSEESWFSAQGELGTVRLVEGLDAGSLGESVLDLLSVLLVDDGQVSRDGLSDELILVKFLMGSNRRIEGILCYLHFEFPQLFFCEIQ
jgi:hypothetical protein